MEVTVRLRHALSGQAIVEFALVGLMFFALVFGTIEFGRLVWTNHELENGTREAMRYAVVHGATSGDPANNSDLETVLLNRSVGIGDSVVVNCTNCGGVSESTVTVTSTYQFNSIITDLIGLNSTVSLESTSQGVIHK